jgi:ribosome-binding factor A
MFQKTPKNPNRISKINSHIQQVLGEILREFLSEHEGLVTVTRVETSRDIKWAKVWISILGGSDQDILGTIEKNIYDIQGELNRTFTTKIVPRLKFFLDTSPRYVQHIEELVRKIHEEDK